MFGCVETFYFVTNNGWTFCVPEVFLFRKSSMDYFSFDTCHLGMRLYKRNVRLCEVSFICLQTVSEHENPETDIDTFCT